MIWRTEKKAIRTEERCDLALKIEPTSRIFKTEGKQGSSLFFQSIPVAFEAAWVLARLVQPNPDSPSMLKGFPRFSQARNFKSLGYTRRL